MKWLFSYILLLFIGTLCHAQIVSNVQFEQVNRQVKITYNLEKQADISVSVSEDGGTTWHAPLKQVSGDVGKKVQPGSKTIYWDVLAEYYQLVGTNICFKVTPALKAENLTFTVNGVSFTMVYVEGGTFTMGATPEQGRIYDIDESPTHEVILSAFYIGQYEVTQGLWQAVMGSNPACFKNGNSWPVENVSWNDCLSFIKELNHQLSGQLNGKRFALPPEEQWEYAARGGQDSKGYKYSGSNNLTKVGWYIMNSSNDTHTHMVGQKLSNELGLYDMSGNVWEWCQNGYYFYPAGAQTNPVGASPKSNYVFRGGSYNYHASRCRVSNRGYDRPTYRDRGLGLRLALIIPE